MRKLLYILPLISLVACETYDADYTANEISYKTEAKSFFANADPSHDWMINDDQIFVCSKSINEATRALTGSAGVPTVALSDDRYTFSKSEAESALNYMAETKDNRGKCVQNFEYLAVGTTTYEIMPVFWGTKFVNTNYVGVYYIDESGNKVDLDPFWSDADGTMHYVTNVGEASIPAMTDQLTKVSTVDVTRSVGICGSTNFSTSGWISSKTYTCKTCNHNYSKSEYEALPDGKCNQPKTQTDKAQITGYSSPVFTITVPNGVKWGLYLQTKTTQSNGKDIRWYSNADYNVNLCNSAATFTYANVTYVSFEDAPNPYNCSKTPRSGHQCTSHPGENDTYNGTFGHWDHDMNDIILTITPRPIESTYKYATVRVMCEDLGGTYDWDFNDVVYDITYEETSKTSSQVRLTLKALGGTLPVRMYYKGQAVGNELHSLAPDAIDVLKDSCAVKEYSVDITTLSADGYDLTNFKNIAKDITLRVIQKDGTTQDVVFPQYQGDNTPQCFMTSVSTPWSYERVSIKDTYPLFESWVTNQNLTTNWWESNPNF